MKKKVARPGRGSAKKGKAGPAKKPTNQLKASGAGNDKRREANFQEPIPILGIPRIPDDVQGVMDEKAREHWDAVCPVLDRMGVLGDIDAHEIARYCVIFAKWYDAEKFLANEGPTYMVMNLQGEKNYKPYPEAALAIKYADQLLKIEGQFGMSPSARASVDISKNPRKGLSTAAKYMTGA